MQETKHTELCEKQWLPAGRTFPTDKVQANKTGDLGPIRTRSLTSTGCAHTAGPAEALHSATAGRDYVLMKEKTDLDL